MLHQFDPLFFEALVMQWPTVYLVANHLVIIYLGLPGTDYTADSTKSPVNNDYYS